MKNAFNSNLPKANPKLKSAVSVMASPSGGGAEEPKEREQRPAPEAPTRRNAAQLSSARGVPPSLPPSPPRTGRARNAVPPQEAGRNWFSMVTELEGYVNRALEVRSRTRVDVDDARTVLARTADAAADALHQLASVEKQLLERTELLSSLLAEMDELKHNRSHALNLARRLARLERGLA